MKNSPKLPKEPQRDLPRARLRELKDRIQADYYDSPEILDSLADRLLHSGDLGDANP